MCLLQSRSDTWSFTNSWKLALKVDEIFLWFGRAWPLVLLSLAKSCAVTWLYKCCWSCGSPFGQSCWYFLFSLLVYVGDIISAGLNSWDVGWKGYTDVVKSWLTKWLEFGKLFKQVSEFVAVLVSGPPERLGYSHFCSVMLSSCSTACVGVVWNSDIWWCLWCQDFGSVGLPGGCWLSLLGKALPLRLWLDFILLLWQDLFWWSWNKLSKVGWISVVTIFYVH